MASTSRRLRTPVFVGSWNAGPAAKLALKTLLASARPPLLDALVKGIALIEDDPEEMSVGLGGLPNEVGEVELDAALMDGNLHRAGGVAGLKRVKNAAAVAREVLRRTDHALLVGEGALTFARQCGFPEQDLLTPKAREAWLAWKARLSIRDGWIGPDDTTQDFGDAVWAGHESNDTPGRPPEKKPATPAPGQSSGAPEVPFTFGTVHLSALVPGQTQSGQTQSGQAEPEMAAVTSTSGLSYKIPGRVGDSPIVGAGLYCDARTGSAGATGRGEATLQCGAALLVVEAMARGMDPTEACVDTLRRIASRTRERRLLDAHGRPTFNVTLYALRADGLTGSASMHAGYTHVASRGGQIRLVPSAYLFPKPESAGAGPAPRRRDRTRAKGGSR
ncbi:MAG: isoaspartyl peptidase/L-asparaginase [Planctomycetota bacterium]|nr:isoaspartyl peptidase/L-asparaginase [Planctomycetota bacterium]